MYIWRYRIPLYLLFATSKVLFIRSRGVKITRMSISLADQTLIRSIFFLNTSSTLPQESTPIFSWEGNSPGSGWTEYLYINDSHKKVQWIFPAYTSYPAFLSLQNSAYPLSQAQRLRYRLFFAMGWKRQLANGTFYVKDEETFPLHELLHSVPHESFAILTNTTGNFRKSVIVLNRGKYSTHFIKLAHSPRATELVYNEVYALQILAQRRLRKVVHPFLSHTDGDHAIIISSVKSQKAQFSKDLKPIHFEGVRDIYKNFSHFRALADLPYVHKIEDYLSEISKHAESFKEQGDTDLAQKLADLLLSYRVFAKSIPSNKEVWVSLSHGDFLPWNMYVSESRMYVFDWEYMQESLPLLYDLFYFIYHTHLVYHKGKANKIQDALQQFFQHPKLKEIVDQYQIDPALYHKLYLMIDIPYLLVRELKRSSPHSDQELEVIFDYWMDILVIQTNI